METRKLQQVGGGTYTVSIPKAWAVGNGLEAGSTVHLYTHTDGSIVVRSSAKEGDALERIELEVTGANPERVSRALTAAYGEGYETVTLRPVESFTADQLRAARRTKRNLVGTEILVERADEITLRNLLDASDVSIRQSVVQLQFVALAAHRRSTAMLPAADVDLDRLRERAEEAERLYAMIDRHFTRSLRSMGELDRLGVSRTALFDYQTLAAELAGVANLGVSIGEVWAGEDPAVSAEPLPEVATAAREVVDDAATAVLQDADAEAINGILDRSEAVREDVGALESALAIDEPGWRRRRTLGHLGRTLDHAVAITRVGLRAAVRSRAV